MRRTQYPVPSTQYGDQLSEGWITNLRFRLESLSTDVPEAGHHPPTSEDEVRSTKYEVRVLPWA